MPILNKYKRWIPQISLRMDEYWDMVLSQTEGPSDADSAEDKNKCLSSFIDFSNEECFSSGNTIMSLSGYSWENAVNSGYSLEDIGFTGMDNGLILFDKFDPDLTDEIFFKEYLTGSKLELESGDTRLYLHAVSGNTQLYKYPYEINEEEGYVSFKGGFFQGFYKLYGFDYDILPSDVDSEWNFEFKLRPMDYLEEPNTLNTFYPENRGIFFFMGTRAENKFAQFYNSNINDYPVVNGRYDISDEYFSFDWLELPDEMERRLLNRLLLLNFLYSEFPTFDNCSCNNNVPKNRMSNEKLRKIYDYIDNADIYGPEGTDIIVRTKRGAEAEKRGYFEIETDNKYLFFDRTKNGFTTETWDPDTDVYLTGYTTNLSDNLFLTVHKGESGLTAADIREIEESSGDTSFYNINKDTEGNAFALRIKEDGSIGYRYMVKDCDVDTPSYDSGYTVLEEYSFPGVIKMGEWTTVNIKLTSINQKTLKISIYVNGMLKFISKEIPSFNFKELDETFDKQEGVPYNISIGGGTQGLMESIWLDYKRAFDRKLPMETHFAGTFVGDISSFKFFTCPLTLNQIRYGK